MNLEDYIEKLHKETLLKFKEYINILYIQTISKCSETSKVITDELIDDYLKKRGYTMNYVLDKRVMVKGFVCVFAKDGVVEIWHDKINNNKSVFIRKSLLTGLPLILNYMEKI